MIGTTEQNDLEALFKQHGAGDFTWLEPEKIVVAEWVRMKCRFGCEEYGHAASCPPNTPSVNECERFFREYEKAALFHFTTSVVDPEARFAWTREINRGLVRLERAVFLAGYYKAFVLFMDSCNLCPACAAERAQCCNQGSARPAPEAMAVDVFATVRRYGFPLQVLTDYSQPMHRYSILLIE